MSAVTQLARSGAPLLDLSEEQVTCLAQELVVYHRQFAGLFCRQEQRGWALKYLQGLLLPNRNKCVEGLALSVEGGHVRNMQLFIGAGRWEDRAILHRHAELVGASMGERDGVLIVDGSEFPKKGKHSAGVRRQYCGATGKCVFKKSLNGPSAAPSSGSLPAEAWFRWNVGDTRSPC